ncbi:MULTISPECIES: 50S ribosomal protein L29 [Aquirufa]|jgi:large subunit ribosomal protein L29|uniref:Large ribosomal subunit protein uL29 n=4 Tax=Aquirufa TaxID=2676247 RepID=A0A4Q9BH65_9BACT|nr:MULTISPECIES: 50S ribosomal protein L29 [Aquirufa]MCE4217724.1 50S ribosomal protein L29 [Pseudarcicella sp. GAP-15]MDE2392090.1 50S ribosomal protein L29 [Cytophagales bacterium]MCZ2477606.1 50S ribosomal protein L29 [Aquirufa antheringensis]MCZ2485156.1 50S ribosomal protein L29 [Aquirufa antheringensis]MCZ2487338.1 50S ribosomal protein L29 [Aquirufa antheringensis]
MKNAEIQKLGVEELKKQIAAEQENISRLKLAHAISPIENPMRIRQNRKLIAKLETALSAATKA